MKVIILSFSYKSRVPEDKTGNGGGFVFDCRAMPNPYWDESLRGYTGRDKPIAEFFDRYKDKVDCFLGAAETLVHPHQLTRKRKANCMKCIVELFGDDRNGRKMIAWGRRIGCGDVGHVFDPVRRKVATRLLVDDDNLSQKSYLLELVDNPVGVKAIVPA